VVALRLLPPHEGCGQFDPLAPAINTGALEQRTQVLLDGARADFEFIGNFLIAAAFQQQTQDLPVALCDLEFL
jgi:hypothetical protein